MLNPEKLKTLRRVITENLRVQRDAHSDIKYIDVANALVDACARQNHTIFARRGCGKTLLLRASTKALDAAIRTVYLNCEDFKRHSFPNVLIEILDALFAELEIHLSAWFGRKRRARELVQNIRHDLAALRVAPERMEQSVKTVDSNSANDSAKFGIGGGVGHGDIDSLFKGEGFDRLVMAGGGVPRDVLSLFLEVLSAVQSDGDGRIGKDDVRILSRENFERRIEELKQDSEGDVQDSLMRGIYVLREFCLDKKTNLFVVSERLLQQNDQIRSLIYRLLDYRIIHNVGNALTHKSLPGVTYQAFVIDIGCYAHLRKLDGRFVEIDVSSPDLKEKARSSAVFDLADFDARLAVAPADVELALLTEQ